MRTVLLLVLGGALGTLARYGMTLALPRGGFPWGTVAVNALGSLAIGVAMGVWVARGLGEEWRLLVVGFLGAFTTMSAFAFESVAHLEDGRWSAWALHFALHPLLAIVAAGAGLWAGRALVA